MAEFERGVLRNGKLLRLLLPLCQTYVYYQACIRFVRGATSAAGQIHTCTHPKTNHIQRVFIVYNGS
jgi:hypothetical protein